MAKVKTEYVVVRWTTSKGRDTYGYNICSMLIDGNKEFSCNGGGYDMTGTVWADFIKSRFLGKLKKLNASKFYGLRFYNTKRQKCQNTWTGEHVNVSLDGACGMMPMETIMDKLKIKREFIVRNKNQELFCVSYPEQ